MRVEGITPGFMPLTKYGGNHPVGAMAQTPTRGWNLTTSSLGRAGRLLRPLPGHGEMLCHSLRRFTLVVGKARPKRPAAKEKRPSWRGTLIFGNRSGDQFSLTAMSSSLWSASVRLGSSASLPCFSASVKALNSEETFLPSNASCFGSRHSVSTSGRRRFVATLT